MKYRSKKEHDGTWSTNWRQKNVLNVLKDFLIFDDICTLSHCHGNTMEAFEDDTPCWILRMGDWYLLMLPLILSPQSQQLSDSLLRMRISRLSMAFLKSKKTAYLPLGKHSWAGKSQFHVCRRVTWHCCHLICSVALHRQIGYVDLCSQYMTKLRCSSWCGTVCHVKETTWLCDYAAGTLAQQSARSNTDSCGCLSEVSRCLRCLWCLCTICFL